MTDAFLHLGFYGVIAQQLVQFLKGIYKPKTVLGDRIMAAAVAALMVYWLGVDPVAALKVGKVVIHPVLGNLVGTGILAGFSMGSHDAFKIIKGLRDKYSNGNGNGGGQQ